MRPLLAAALLALLLAGCLDARAPVSPALAPRAGPSPAPIHAASAGSAPAEKPTERSDPIGFDGKIPAYAQACVWSQVTTACPYTPVGDYSRIVDQPRLDGAPVSGVVTATWRPATPAQQTMLLTAYSYDANGGFASFGYVEGASPLRLTMARIALPPGQALVIGLFPAEHNAWAPVGVGGWAKASPTDQAFRLDGAILVH